jgi:SAM-dependent methyltransferase
MDLLAAVWQRLGARPYNAIYRRGAPWERTPRAELVDLLTSRRLHPGVTLGPRALDVGCGSGADSLMLAEHGFEVTGVDFSPVAIDKALAAAGDRPRVSFVQADLFALPAEVMAEPFDLIFDGGTVDDFPSAARRTLAGVLAGLARPGTVLLMWCFSATPDEAPWFSLAGPSRLGGLGILPAEISALFGSDWNITELPTANPAERAAFYWMTMR